MNSKWYWLIRQKYRNLKFQIKKKQLYISSISSLYLGKNEVYT